MTEGLPKEWSRGPQWASTEIRREWEPVLAAARAAWMVLEIVSVSAGVRPSALVHLTSAEVPKATLDAAGQGLLVVPLEYDGQETRAAVTRPARVADWLLAWSGCDDEKIGELLGYPECCRKHFAETWGKGVTDTVTTIASAGSVDGPPEANLLLRHLGVRLVPHLLCSPDCEATVELGRAIAEAGREAGADVDSVYRLLDLPATYSALHGVAVVETPVLRFWAGTDYTPEEVRVTRAATQTRASARVSGGAHNPTVPGSTPGPATKREDVDTSEEVPTTWHDNGFTTREAMDAAHDVVLQVVAIGCDAGDLRRVDSAIDLGAGDGTLLAKIAGGREGIWIGVEKDEGRAVRGMERHSCVAIETTTIEDAVLWPEEEDEDRPGSWVAYDVALLMPGRLLEMSREDADRVLAALPCLARRLVVYAYGDTLREHGDLGQLAAKAGLPALSRVVVSANVQAGEVTW